MVEYRFLEIFERLWEDYSFGYLEVIVEKWIVMDDIWRKLDVKCVKLKIIILKGVDKIECKSFLMDIIGENN